MADLNSKSRGPGFQRSETSSAELHIYKQPADPALFDRNPGTNKDIKFTGRSIRDDAPSLVSLSTSKEMGDSGGTWSATVKQPSPVSRRTDLREMIADDAWADIHFNRHNRRHFVMRGMVNEIRRVQSAGRGATTVTYNISGSDFTKVWQLTPIWFNKYIDGDNTPENIGGAVAQKVFTALGFGKSVPTIVKNYLFGFLEELGKLGRASWELPGDMLGTGEEKAFIKNIQYIHKGIFTNDPPRQGISPNFLDPNGANAWAMAQEWSDPAFCELFTDLVNWEGFGQGERQLSEDNSRMSVVLRDRPFPVVGSLKNQGMDSPYFKLPTIEIPREDVVTDDLGRGGMERYNAFFVSPQVTQEFLRNSGIEITAPSWDREDIDIHGLRRFDINSRYTLDVVELANQGNTEQINDSLLTITKNQRAKIRDWYCMNPYLYNGSIELGRGEPEAHIGFRCRIPGRIPAEDFTGYIESVSHNWQFGQGIKTNLGVTRGWYGTDKDYMDTLRLLAGKYDGNRQGD